MIAEIATLYPKITDAFQQKKPFVSYCKPNSNTVNLLIQKDTKIHLLDDFSESGFVFAPFDDSKKPVYFALENCDLEHFIISDTDIFTTNTAYLPNENLSLANRHENLVKKGVDFIKEHKISKIVLSRRETITIPNFDFLDTFKALLNNYKSAFTYIWYHPEIGLWMGATPETLIQTNNLNFKTMSLAGTQIYRDSLQVVWKEKEKQEHQFVTDYISKELDNLNIKHQITEPYTIKAANIVHLCADISGRLDNSKKMASVITALHPTPAVCGLPKKTAKQFIINNEGYDRAFYTGFLGELNFEFDSRQQKNNRRNIENHAYTFKKRQSALFVNLRCMQIENNNILLYLGGGITKDSNPKKEYLETVAKAETIKKALMSS